MRILFLTQLFDPEPSHLKGLKFATELTRLGHEVKVLTCLPNYPAGSIYPGYRGKPWSYEAVDGVEIFRLPLYPSHDVSGSRRAASYISYAVSASVAIGLVGKTDLVHVYQGPATLALPALLNRALRHTPFVYDIQDLWPDTIQLSGMGSNETLLRLVDRWCCHVYKRSARIVTLSPGMKALLVARGVPQGKVDVVYNWADDILCKVKERAQDVRRSLGLGDEFVLMYAGNMGPLQSLGILVEAARMLQSAGSTAKVVLVGGGTEVARLRTKVAELAITNIVFVDRQAQDAMVRLYGAADALFVQLRDTPLSAITIPQKIQAYMAAGKPIIAAITGDGADLVRWAEAGVTCRPEIPKEIAESVRMLEAMSPESRSKMGGRGRDFYRAHLTLRAGAEHFDRIYRDALDPSRRRAR